MTITQQPLPSQRSGRLSTKGNKEPRIFTPPLRELTPETSYGFAVITFARDVLQQPLTPWQQWAVIHLGELLEDGRPRFRKALILVARQNGKTHLLKVLAAFWMTVQRVEQILGLSTTATAAREAWNKTRELIESNSILLPFLAHVRTANDDPHMRTTEGSIYRTKAANREASRGLTVDRIIFDELREQKSFEAWDAVLPTMAARPGAQAIAISNAGDDRSVVLNKLQESALEFINSGTGDFRTGLFEWSAAPGDDISDPQTWAKANPNMGYVFSEDELRGDAIAAVNQGGEVLTGFKTERLCMRVSALDSAVDADRWNACFTEDLSWQGLARQSALFLDIPLSQKRATLVAAYTRPDGTTQIGVLKEWRDENAMAQLESDLLAILTDSKRKPRAFGWMPIGPAASKATLKNLKVPGVAIEQYTGEVADACMTFADLVKDKMVVHSSNSNDLLSVQVTGAAKKYQGDRWRFDRKGSGDCDAAFAAAGAVLLARSLPPRKTQRLIGPDDGEEDE